MKKQLVQQTNGHTKEVGKPVKKTRLEKLKELEKQIKMLQEQEKNSEEIQTKKTLKQNIQEIFLLTKFIAGKRKTAKEMHIQVAEETEKLAKLEKAVGHYKAIYGGLQELQKLDYLPVATRDKKTIEILKQEINRLQILDKTQREIITKDMISTPVITQTLPVMKKTLHPIRLFQAWKKYRKEVKQFKTLVRNIDKTDINFTLSQQNDNSIKILNNGTRGYKAENAVNTKDYYKVGDTYFVTYYVSDLPRVLYPDALYKLLLSTFPFSITTYVKPLNNQKLIKQVRSRLADLESNQRDIIEKGKVRSYKVDKSMEEMTELVQELTQEVEKGFDVSCYITLESDSEKGIKELHAELKNITDTIELYVTKYTYGQKKAFTSTLPFNEDQVREHRFLNTTGVSYITPFLTKTMYDPKGIFLGINVNQEGLIFLDPFTISNDPMRNNNMVILGTSGSGKSTIAKIIATRLYMEKVQIVIIDPEGEYVEYAKAMGGEVIQFARGNGINIFTIYRTSGNLQYDILDHVTILKTFFKFFVSDMLYDEVELDETLIELYENYPTIKPTYKLLLRIMKKRKSKMYGSFAKLETGTLQGIFNAERELKLTNDLVVFDSSSLKDSEMMAPAMYLLTSLVWQMVDNSRNRQKMLFIDEAHNLLAKEDVAKFYKNLVKKARKRNVGVVSITQNVEDFLLNEWGVGIITNSETKILLKQPTASFELLDKVAVLSQEEKLMLGSLPIGEFVLIREQEHIHAYTFVLPSERKYVFTTPGENTADENTD